MDSLSSLTFDHQNSVNISTPDVAKFLFNLASGLHWTFQFSPHWPTTYEYKLLISLLNNSQIIKEIKYKINYFSGHNLPFFVSMDLQTVIISHKTIYTVYIYMYVYILKSSVRKFQDSSAFYLPISTIYDNATLIFWVFFDDLVKPSLILFDFPWNEANLENIMEPIILHINGLVCRSPRTVGEELIICSAT